MVKYSVKLIVMLIFMLCVQHHLNYTEERIPAFDLDEYQEMIGLYPSDTVLSPVMNADDAKKLAEIVWLEKYGEDVLEEKPYKVFFDAENKVWLVQGTLPDGWWGGVAHILIEQGNGRVLAVWHTL